MSFSEYAISWLDFYALWKYAQNTSLLTPFKSPDEYNSEIFANICRTKAKPRVIVDTKNRLSWDHLMSPARSQASSASSNPYSRLTHLHPYNQDIRFGVLISPAIDFYFSCHANFSFKLPLDLSQKFKRARDELHSSKAVEVIKAFNVVSFKISSPNNSTLSILRLSLLSCPFDAN